MQQSKDYRIGFWLQRALFVLVVSFVLLLGVELLKGHALAAALEFGLIWSVISTTIFTGTRIYYVSRGNNCPMCNDLPQRQKAIDT